MIQLFFVHSSVSNEAGNNNTMKRSFATTGGNNNTSLSSSHAPSVCRLIPEPAPHDVLCGQDKTWSDHLGNRLFRSKIVASVLEYKSGSKKAKMALTRTIVMDMKRQYSTRFIRVAKTNPTGSQQQHQQYWEEISDKLARDKGSHALRTYVSNHCCEGESDSTSNAAVASQQRVRSNSNVDSNPCKLSSSLSNEKLKSVKSKASTRTNGSDDDDDDNEELNRLYHNQQELLNKMMNDYQQELELANQNKRSGKDDWAEESDDT